MDVIDSIESALSFFTDQSRGNAPLFRGESSDYKETSLIPSYGRNLLEHEIIPASLKNISARSCALHVSEALFYAVNLESQLHYKYFLDLSEIHLANIQHSIYEAQHRGLPTRLLDWSENVLVALYFSCNNNSDKDAFLFRLIPNTQAIPAHILENPYESFKHGSDIQCHIEIIRPPRLSQRSSRQMSIFTHHTAPWLPANHDFGDPGRRGEDGNMSVNLIGNISFDSHQIDKYRIPCSKKSHILDQLSSLGITKQSLGLIEEEEVRKNSFNLLNSQLEQFRAL